MSLYDRSKQAPHEDVFRLKSAELWVPTDEQIAKMRANNPEIPVHVSIKVTYEPLTYRKFIGEDEIKEETDYIRVTKGKGLSVGDEAQNLANVRSAGWNGLPSGSVISLPGNVKNADPDKQTVPYARFMVAASKAGIVLDAGDDGKVFIAKGADSIFVCRNGAEEFPTVNEGGTGSNFWNWSDTRQVFMRVPLREATDFVQPEQLAERRYERKEQEGATAATTTTSAPAALTADSLKAAIALLGIEGKTVSVVNASATSLVSSNIAKNPAVLGSSAVNGAAVSGKFVDWLAEQGVVTVEDGKVVMVD